MKQHPLVSICVPVYNGAAFIESCLRACISQTYQNIEIIVCDDCSTDNTFEIIQKIAKEDPRIKYYQNKSNKGLVGNWNQTLSHASGDYIKWLFQDDNMVPDAIEKFVQVASAGYSFIVSKRNFVLKGNFSEQQIKYYKSGVKTLESYFNKSEKGHYFEAADIAKLSTEFIALNFIGEPSLSFFNKKCIEQAGNYDEKLHQICDMEYSLRIASSEGVFVINDPICSFTIHENSTTNINLDKKFFRLRYFEQAYYAFKLLHDNKFYSLQKKLSRLQKFKLQLYISYRLYEANKNVNKNVNKNQFPEYHDLKLEFPELNNYYRTGIVQRLVFKVIDIVKKRP